MRARDAAIKDAREMRKTHAEWLEHLRLCHICRIDKKLLERVGDAEHHKESIKKYDRILRVLAVPEQEQA